MSLRTTVVAVASTDRARQATTASTISASSATPAHTSREREREAVVVSGLSVSLEGSGYCFPAFAESLPTGTGTPTVESPATGAWPFRCSSRKVSTAEYPLISFSFFTNP